MDRQRLNPGGFGDFGDIHRIAVVLVPAGADFQCDGHIDGFDHRVQNLAHQFFILQQRRTGHHIADFLGRTAHVDVDDLRAMIHIVPRRLRQHLRIRADDLHRNRLHLTLVIGAAQGLFRAIQQRIRRHHLAHRHPRPHALAQHAKRTIRHPRHGRDNKIIFKLIRADTHGRRGGKNGRREL